MTDRLSQIRERCDKATRGEWTLFFHDVFREIIVNDEDPKLVITQGNCPDGRAVVRMSIEDGEFIAHARTDIPYLLDRVAELETRNRELVQATVDQYNAGKAAAAGEMDVVSRANADAHRMVDRLSDANRALLKMCTENRERAEAAESKLAAAEELARAVEGTLEGFYGVGPLPTLRAALSTFRETKP